MLKDVSKGSLLSVTSQNSAGGTNIKTLLFLFIAFALAGCELAPTRQSVSQPPSDWAQRQQKLSAFDHWTLQGKLAFRQGKHYNNLVINRWQQQDDHFNIHVSSALLGLGATTIEGSPDYIGLHQPEEASLFSDQPDQLLAEALGWSLPMSLIPYWVKGLPSPDQPSELLFDQQGNPYFLTQASWQVELDRFEALDGLMLPHKITLTQGDVRIKVVISSWENH